jgi:Cd2+/Zn2+-exporting ATPase
MNTQTITQDKANNYSNYTFYLNGLSCANCAAKIENRINTEDKYRNVSFSFATKKLNFNSHLPENELQISLQKLVNKIEDGVSVDVEDSMAHNDCNNSSCSMDASISASNITLKNKINFREIGRKNISMLIGSILLLIALIFDLPPTYSIITYVAAYLLIGYDVILHALKNIVRGNLFDEYFLMTLATIGALALGEYTEAVAVMFFYKIGENFQDYAVDKSRRSIQSLLHIKADFANKIIGNEIIKVSPESLKINDLVLIRAGEKIPTDGIIVEGSSSLDTSALTGESYPREVFLDDEVLSGSINKSGTLKIQVTKTYENSTVARILDLVENATGKKAKTEQFITKFAKVYTPIVVISAITLALLPPLLGFGSYGDWISRALIFLVISCPCALVLSVPLAYFAGLGKASSLGILIKGGNYLEALNTIDTYVFDKTGTLTTGKFAVTNYSNEETLALAAYIEQYSSHPLALSVLNAYKGELTSNTINDVVELPGKGLRGTYKNKSLFAGNKRLMTQENISVPDVDWVGSIIYIAHGKKYIGHIEISDKLKENVFSLSSKLKEVGAKFIYLLSGDQKSIVTHTAKILDFDECHGELLPDDKLSYIEKYISENKNVLFAGDGINDAPVLARANIGVAMGGMGSDAAVEAADIILMTDEPGKLIEAKKIAKYTRKIVLQNIIFALGVKLFFLTLGAFGIATMYEAIFADVGVALLAVLNSIRILKKKL